MRVFMLRVIIQTQKNDDTGSDQSVNECEIPKENHIITTEPVSPSDHVHPMANANRDKKSEKIDVKKDNGVKNVVKKNELNEQSDKPVKVFYRMEGSDKIISDEEFPIKNVNYSKLDKIWQESTIWFPKHERTNEIPP